jgi:hypothetical protein
MSNVRIFDTIFPLIYAISVNKDILEAYQEIESKRNEELSKVMTGITKKANEIPSIEKMTDDAYTTELQRKGSLELKGAALLGAVAVAVSIISISIGILSDKSQTDLQFVILGAIFTYAIIHLISSGIASIPTISTYRFYIATTSDIIEKLNSDAENLKEKWIADKIVGTKINSHILLMINNYVSAAVTHFKHGLIALAIGYLLLYTFEVLLHTSSNGTDKNQIDSNSSNSSMEILIPNITDTKNASRQNPSIP